MLSKDTIITLLAVAFITSCTQNTNLIGRLATDAGPDGGAAAACVPGGTQCNNCVDDDGDGLTDGFDPHCVGPKDDREDSFATGIAGDNNNTNFQDCFFDGNSGHGDDGCRLPTCCLTDPGAPNCPPPGTPAFITCDPTEVCIENCAPSSPPGCDCFGCCTVCAGGLCRDIVTHPLLAPECDVDVLADTDKCPSCQQSTCGTTCDPDNCILCPGQTDADLPAHCADRACPDNLATCTQNTDCSADRFCSVGCCILRVL